MNSQQSGLAMDSVELDVLVIGGGVAGLWVLDALCRGGHEAILVEHQSLGTGQTVCSQGIIHGGLKYTLMGRLTDSAKAIREMPGIWRACLDGSCEPNLSDVHVSAGYCHLWRTTSLMSQVGMIGARAGLQTKAVVVAGEDRPVVLEACPGEVFRLDEQVVDVPSLLECFSRRMTEQLLQVDAEGGVEFETSGGGEIVSVGVRRGGRSCVLRPRWVVLTAGSGNASLREQAGLSGETMQLRPLHMVMVRGDLPELHGHCADGAKTRVTITSSRDHAGRRVWLVGGQVAEDGVEMDGASLCARVKRELNEVLPGVALDEVEWASYRVDRAEGRTGGLGRPSGVQVSVDGNVITGWPTKLALGPAIADEVLRRIGPAMADDRGTCVADSKTVLADWDRPKVAEPPWERETQWIELD